MKKLFLGLLLMISVATFVMVGMCAHRVQAQSTSQSDHVNFGMRKRIARIKQSVVRVLAGTESGTGFVVAKNGLIATCFHVVGTTGQTSDGKTVCLYATDIRVVFSDGSVLPAHIYRSCLGGRALEASARDYAILQVDSSNLTPCALGVFSNAYEGTRVYTCGYPLGLTVPFTSTGTLSALAKTDNPKLASSEHDVAFLDMTMNVGNSGGPIVEMGDSIDQDRVIAIADFILTPVSQPLNQILKANEDSPVDIGLGGVSLKKLTNLMGKAIQRSSVGIGGCISIDYLKNALK